MSGEQRIINITNSLMRARKDQMENIELSEHIESDLRWKLYDELHPPKQPTNVSNY